MKLKYLLFSIASTFVFAQKNIQTPFEKGNGNQTATCGCEIYFTLKFHSFGGGLIFSEN